MFQLSLALRIRSCGRRQPRSGGTNFFTLKIEEDRPLRPLRFAAGLVFFSAVVFFTIPENARSSGGGSRHGGGAGFCQFFT